jgi:hypothetical protein
MCGDWVVDQTVIRPSASIRASAWCGPSAQNRLRG